MLFEKPSMRAEWYDGLMLPVTEADIHSMHGNINDLYMRHHADTKRRHNMQQHCKSAHHRKMLITKIF